MLFFLSFIRSQVAFKAEEQQLDAAAGEGDARKRLLSGELGVKSSTQELSS